jgi:hypothetical protein
MTMAKARNRATASGKGTRRPMIRVTGTRLPVGKMSEILLAIVEPLAAQLPDPPDPEATDALIHFSAAIWNISRLPDARGREPWIRRLARQEPDGAGIGSPDLSALITELVEMARSLWPDDRRVVLDTEVFLDETGELRVRALSKLGNSVPTPR